MTDMCVCGHTDDLHEDNVGTCTACSCDDYIEELDDDEVDEVDNEIEEGMGWDGKVNSMNEEEEHGQK